MKRIVLVLSLLLGVIISPMQAQQMLSDQAQISVLTCAPYDGEVYTVFGHAAFRVYDPTLKINPESSQKLDVVFNYGIFDQSQSNFIYHFAKGETDYKLGITHYQSYIVEYQMRGSDIVEQVLNLSLDEKNLLWLALLLNAEPQNAVYRYDYFFDNCATRLPQMLEKYIDGKVAYTEPEETFTFREMVHQCTHKHRWLTFGIDLALGSPADRVATPHEMMFLPNYMMEAFSRADIHVDVIEEVVKYPLVSEVRVIEAAEPDEKGFDLFNDLFTPLVCGWLLFALMAFVTWKEWKRKKYYLYIDVILFTVAGIAGIVLFFLCFISEHPCIWPNWSVTWLHPFHLVGVIFFCVKKWKKAAYSYHFINFAALSLMLLFWFFIPQQLNVAFIPLVASLWMRSGNRVLIMRKEK